jgi:CheY-like chemotaxis protein
MHSSSLSVRTDLIAHASLHSRGENPMHAKTILIVDDEETIGELLVQVIQMKTSHQAVWVANGLLALERLASVHPNLLIVDYNLPFMTGIELVHCIHQTPLYHHLPTLMISASNLRVETEAVKSHLIWLRKPFNLIDLFRCIEELLAKT